VLAPRRRDVGAGGGHEPQLAIAGAELFPVAHAAQAFRAGGGATSGDGAKCLPPAQHLAQIEGRRVFGRRGRSRFFR